MRAKAVPNVIASSLQDAVQISTRPRATGAIKTLGCGAGTETGAEVWVGTGIQTSTMTVCGSGAEISSGMEIGAPSGAGSPSGPMSWSDAVSWIGAVSTTGETRGSVVGTASIVGTAHGVRSEIESATMTGHGSTRGVIGRIRAGLPRDSTARAGAVVCSESDSIRVMRSRATAKVSSVDGSQSSTTLHVGQPVRTGLNGSSLSAGVNGVDVGACTLSCSVTRHDSDGDLRGAGDC